MTTATAAQHCADHEWLSGECRQSVLRSREVRATSALVRAQAREVIAEAKAGQRERSARLAST